MLFLIYIVDQEFTTLETKIELSMKNRITDREFPVNAVIKVLIAIVIGMLKYMPTPSRPDIRPLVAQGNAHFADGEYEKAIAAYDQIFEISAAFLYVPGDSTRNVIYRRGLAHYKLGQYEQALEDFKRDIRLFPKLARSYNAAGQAYFDQEEYQRALIEFNRAIEADPGDPLAHYNRGVALSQLGDPKGAIGSLQTALAADVELKELMGTLSALADEGKAPKVEIYGLTKAEQQHAEHLIQIHTSDASLSTPTQE